MQDVQPRGSHETNWWVSGIRGILLIILGVLCFMFPVSALLGLAIMLGIGLVVTGGMGIYQAVKSRHIFAGWGLFLVWGILEIVLGCFLIAHPALTALSIPVIIGIWALITGIIQFTGSFTLKSQGLQTWWLSLLGGILAAVVGVLLIANPVAGAAAIPFWMGSMAILVGIFSLFWIGSWDRMRAESETLTFPPPERRRDEAA